MVKWSPIREPSHADPDTLEDTVALELVHDECKRNTEKDIFEQRQELWM